MKILGIDWGKSHVGLAIGDDQTKLVEPLESTSAASAKKRIKTLCRQQQIELIVVGVSEQQSAQAAQSFARQLKPIGLPVELVDETLSTQDAQTRLKYLPSRKRNQRHHAAAAAIILEQWLEK